MMPVNTWTMKIVSDALPKTYHQLADLLGTGWPAIARTSCPICNRWLNQSAIFSSLRIRLSFYADSRWWIESAVGRREWIVRRFQLCIHIEKVRAAAGRKRAIHRGNKLRRDRDT